MKVLKVITKAFAVPVAAFLTFLHCVVVWTARMYERRHVKRFRQAPRACKTVKQLSCQRKEKFLESSPKIVEIIKEVKTIS
jgi:hypothetical protein